MKLFMTIMLIITLIYLIYGSFWDFIFLATPKIENKVMLGISICTFIFMAIKGTFVFSTIPYIIIITFILLIYILGGKMGPGDGLAYVSSMLIITSTSFLTGENNIWIFLIMWLISCILFVLYAIKTRKKGKRKLPMFPFITFGYIVALIIYFNP